MSNRNMEKILYTRFGKFIAIEKYDDNAKQFYCEMYDENGKMIVEFSTISILEDTDDFTYLFEEWYEENMLKKTS